jgi:UDP-N-acetyl-D-glucosamine dehydrogenase
MKVAVIGQGYVGLTLAVGASHAGHNVVGVDTNIDLIRNIAQGHSHVPGVIQSELQELIKTNKYTPTNSMEKLDGSEVVIIAVPTPLNEAKKPDLKYLASGVLQIAKYVTNEALIINESTSYPGTLRNFIKPLISTQSKVEFLYASAPERIDPGNSHWSLLNTPRIVAGLTTEAADKAIKFYETFCANVSKVSSPEIAEAAKLFENTFRQVNIALANEFSVICNVMGFSSHEAIQAAATKPFGFMPFFPSIGVGGHCIPIDPSYLSYAAELAGSKANFIDLANKINLSMHKHVVYRIKKEVGRSLKDLRIQIVGIAYKPGVADLRESSSLLLIKELVEEGVIVSWHDPLVSEYKGTKSTALDPTVDLGLIVTPHPQVDFKVWLESRTRVLDLSSDSKNYGWPKFL